MNKIIFGIFAHPDDEAFGPAGALLLETKNGATLHLITLTNGGGGSNPDNVPDLGTHRLGEWEKAGSLLGAASLTHLGYHDGQLTNAAMLEISQSVADIIKDKLDGVSNTAEIEIMTFDRNGLTGHIDHIVAARAASYVFHTLKKTDSRLRRLRLFCLTEEYYPTMNTDWLFMDKGRSDDEIDEIIDARSLREEILEIMRAHASQRADAGFHIERLGDDLGRNHFIIEH